MEQWNLGLGGPPCPLPPSYLQVTAPVRSSSTDSGPSRFLSADSQSSNSSQTAGGSLRDLTAVPTDEEESARSVRRPCSARGGWGLRARGRGDGQGLAGARGSTCRRLPTNRRPVPSNRRRSPANRHRLPPEYD